MITVNKVFIHAPQDPSVGLFGVGLTIDMMGYETDDLEGLRETLAGSFSDIYDDGVRVIFEFEEQ
jgi:hypothetical protein